MSVRKTDSASVADRLLDLLASSVIVQGLVTLCLVGVLCYLALRGQPIPEELKAAALLCLGYYFGSKSQQTIMLAAGHGR